MLKDLSSRTLLMASGIVKVLLKRKVTMLLLKMEAMVKSYIALLRTVKLSILSTRVIKNVCLAAKLASPFSDVSLRSVAPLTAV